MAESKMAETLAHNRCYGIPIENALPRTVVAVDSKMREVLDVRDGKVRK
jgi:hypothetical protein